MTYSKYILKFFCILIIGIVIIIIKYAIMQFGIKKYCIIYLIKEISNSKRLRLYIFFIF